MRQFLISIMFIMTLAACNKNSSTSTVSGLYIENSPINGRSQLNFINGNLVIKTETGSNYADTFRYSITTAKIILTPNWTTQYSAQEFDFTKIDDRSFKIQNLYPSIPENPKTYMIFKR